MGAFQPFHLTLGNDFFFESGQGYSFRGGSRQRDGGFIEPVATDVEWATLRGGAGSNIFCPFIFFLVVPSYVTMVILRPHDLLSILDYSLVENWLQGIAP